MIGQSLGPYQVLSKLGEGGMGEVYKARDTRLDRMVAIKVLPEHLASDPEFRQRFDREARVISQLDHPHICALYDVGEQASTGSGPAVAYLVMQYLEGETLQDHLTKGALPLDQALTIAIQIAGALDRAHRAGVVHRDLKPGNVMITKAGAKLLDFGLAKVGGPIVAGAGLSMLPTTPPNMTAKGTILGTFQYMAPEQLEGQEADARTDIFAFGAQLYEMVTGRKAFEGKSQASLISAIMSSQPQAMPSLQPATPPALDHVVSRCLAKDPDERWQSAGDVMRELKWIVEAGSTASPPVRTAAGQVSRERLAWSTAVALALIAAAALVWAFRPVPPAPEMRLEITTPPAPDRVSQVSVAMSLDGRKVVFVGESEGRSLLWVRSLDAVSPRPLDRTDDASYPFWAPDGRSVGFFADGKLKRIDLDGGTVQTLSDASSGRGGTWNRDGLILFSGEGRLIFRIPSSGGQPVAVTRFEAQDRASGRIPSHLFPQFLPDGRHFLYVARRVAAPGLYVGQVDAAETRHVVEADAGTAAAYASGHLLFVRQGTLLAQPFDPVRLSLTGDPFSVADGVGVVGAGASGSAASAIVYRTATFGRQPRQFVWFDRSGKEIAKVGDPYTVDSGNPSMSRDGRYVALIQVEGENPSDLWLLDTARGVFSRFTSDPFINNGPVWSPDGSRIVFQSNPKGVFDLYQKATASAGSMELLLATAQSKMPNDWSPDGRFLLYQSGDRTMGWDLWALPLDGDRPSTRSASTPFPVVQSSAEERSGQFSPDGKWITYQSDETGRFEIYMQPFPGPGGKVRISTNGGAQVRWRRDGQELFYVALDDRLMAVRVRITPDGRSVEPGVPVPLFKTRLGGAEQSAPALQQYVVSPDGQRFGINTVLGEAAASPITLILNWQPRR